MINDRVWCIHLCIFILFSQKFIWLRRRNEFIFIYFARLFIWINIFFIIFPSNFPFSFCRGHFVPLSWIPVCAFIRRISDLLRGYPLPWCRFNILMQNFVSPKGRIKYGTWDKTFSQVLFALSIYVLHHRTQNETCAANICSFSLFCENEMFELCAKLAFMKWNPWRS